MMYKLIKTEMTTASLLFLDRQIHKILQLCTVVLGETGSTGWALGERGQRAPMPGKTFIEFRWNKPM